MIKRTVLHELAALLVGTLWATASVVAQTTWYVDDNAPGDPGPGDPAISDPAEDGSIDHPFDAIQEGIDAAVNGDTVLVLDGTYTGDGNRDMDYGGKLITVHSQNGPDGCFIDCQAGDADRHRAFLFQSGEGADSVLDGFTIQNGHANLGGALSILNGSPLVLNCVFDGNYANGGGALLNQDSLTLVGCQFKRNSSGGHGGVIYNIASDLSLTNCAFSGNLAHIDGGVIFNWGGVALTAVTCTFVGNSAEYGSGAALACESQHNPATVEMDNCVLWNEGVEFHNDNGSLIYVTYSDVRGGWPGEGNIDADPLLVRHPDAGPDGEWGTDDDVGNLHLLPQSPCIDAGDNTALPPDTFDLDGDGDIDEPLPIDLDGGTRLVGIPCVQNTGNPPDAEDMTDMGALEVANTDCNGNGASDACDILDGISTDCNTNGIPDDCIDLEDDCNGNSVPDACDIADGTSADCNGNGIPDECIDLEDDCNGNSVPDACDIVDGTSVDCNGNGIPDECIELEDDCNGNAVPDECDVLDGTSEDCNGNEIPDECEPGGVEDCNENGIFDLCDLYRGASADRNENAIPDECDIADGTSDDYDLDGQPDECDSDCNLNGIPDACDIDCAVGNCASHPLGCGGSQDLNRNGVPDDCEADRTIYVDDDAPHDPGPGDPAVSDPAEDGSPEHPYNAIQEGIAAAEHHDIVLVLDGTYTGEGNRDLDYGGRLIGLGSENGPDNCIIDCQQAGRGLFFHNGESADAVVEGFTVTNGWDAVGGGMFIYESNTTVTKCVFSDNIALIEGGGVASYDASPTFTDCVFTGNDADCGRGMANYGGSPTVTNCTFSGNWDWCWEGRGGDVQRK